MNGQNDATDFEGRLQDLETGAACAVSGVLPGLLIQIFSSLEQKQSVPKRIGQAFIGGSASAITCGLGGYFLARHQRFSKGKHRER